MPEIVGKVEVKNNVLYLFDGNHSIPLLAWMVSHGIRVGDLLRITVTKESKNEK